MQEDPNRDVFGSMLSLGQRVHFETGPRHFQDWSYSVRLKLTQASQ